MLFVQSLRGLSHTKLEDTKPEHLELAVQALDRLASKTIAWLSDQYGSRRARTAHPRPPAAVVFDCDGLLLETETCWTLAEEELFDRYGKIFGDEEKRALIGTSLYDGLAASWQRLLDQPGRAEPLGLELLELVERRLLEEATAFPGAEALVLELKPRVADRGVASNTPAAARPRRSHLRRYGAPLRGRRHRATRSPSRSPRLTSTSARASSSAPSRRSLSRSRTPPPVSRRRARPACS